MINLFVLSDLQEWMTEGQSFSSAATPNKG